MVRTSQAGCVLLIAVMAVNSTAKNAVAQTTFLFGYDNTTETVLRIDPVTGMSTTVGPLMIPVSLGDPSVQGMAYDPILDVLFASKTFAATTSTPPAELITINRQSGKGTVIANITGAGAQVQSLAVHPITNQLYGMEIDDDELLLIDKVTGAATPIMSGFALFEGLAFDPTGVLYATEKAHDGIDGRLLSIDVDAMTSSVVGDLGFDGVGSLAFDIASGKMFGADFITDQFLEINLTTGAATAIGPMGFGGFASSAMEFATIPEPSSFALVGIAAIGFCAYRWRRRKRAA